MPADEQDRPDHRRRRSPPTRPEAERRPRPPGRASRSTPIAITATPAASETRSSARFTCRSPPSPALAAGRRAAARSASPGVAGRRPCAVSASRRDRRTRRRSGTGRGPSRSASSSLITRSSPRSTSPVRSRRGVAVAPGVGLAVDVDAVGRRRPRPAGRPARDVEVGGHADVRRHRDDAWPMPRSTSRSTTVSASQSRSRRSTTRRPMPSSYPSGDRGDRQRPVVALADPVAEARCRRPRPRRAGSPARAPARSASARRR